MAVHMATFRDRRDWLQHRTRIGGSEAAAVLGMNPWMTNVDLWRQKKGLTTRKEIGDLAAVEYGKQAEEHIRAIFALDHPSLVVHYEPENLWTNDAMPWAHASLDGWMDGPEGKGVLEIKTTNVTPASAKKKWDGMIPQNYFAQILHYMAVTEADFAILKALQRYGYGEDDVFQVMKEYRIEREEVEDDIRALMEAEREFWESLQGNEEPALILPEI